MQLCDFSNILFSLSAPLQGWPRLMPTYFAKNNLHGQGYLDSNFRLVETHFCVKSHREYCLKRTLCHTELWKTKQPAPCSSFSAYLQKQDRARVRSLMCFLSLILPIKRKTSHRIECTISFSFFFCQSR